MGIEAAGCRFGSRIPNVNVIYEKEERSLYLANERSRIKEGDNPELFAL